MGFLGSLMWEPTKNLGTPKGPWKTPNVFLWGCETKPVSLWQVKSLIITLFWNIRMPLKRSALNDELDHRPQNSRDTNTRSDQKIHHQHPTSAPRPVLHPFGNDQKSLPFGESYRDASPNETFTRRLLENNCRMDQLLNWRPKLPKQRAFNACRAFPKVPQTLWETADLHSWAEKNMPKKVSLNSKRVLQNYGIIRNFNVFPPFTSLVTKPIQNHPLFQTPRLDHWNRFIPRLQCWHKRWSRNACEADLDAMISASYSCCFIGIPSGKLT